MPERSKSRLTRPLHPVPAFIRDALLQQKLRKAFDARPPYQRNDYVGWITRAKLEPTKQKRLAQMLEELAGGKLYMKMVYRPKRPPEPDESEA